MDFIIFFSIIRSILIKNDYTPPPPKKREYVNCLRNTHQHTLFFRKSVDFKCKAVLQTFIFHFVAHFIGRVFGLDLPQKP